MNSRLKRAVESEPVPAYLESRVRATIREAELEKVRVWWHAPAWGLAATAAVLLVGFFTLRRQENATIAGLTQQVSALMTVGLTDHLHCTMLRKQQAEPSSQEAMKTQLGPRYAALLPAVESHVPMNYRVLDAHQCKAQGRDFVHLVMQQGDRYLSVVVTERRAGEAFSTKNLVPSLAQAGIEFYQQGAGNFQIAGFESAQHLVYVISELPAEKNRQVMMAIAGDLRRALLAL